MPFRALGQSSAGRVGQRQRHKVLVNQLRILLEQGSEHGAYFVRNDCAVDAQSVMLIQQRCKLQ